MTIQADYYEGIEDFHDTTARRARAFRLNRQAGQSQYVELWCEAAGMLNQLQRVATPYSIHVYSGSGFDSLTAKYDVADRALDRLVPTAILHVGDLDPSGESIFDAMTEDAAAFVEADRLIHNLHIEPVRVALTAEQVEEHDLPTAPPKEEDKRSRNWQGETCQLEALAPDQLAEIVKAAIVERLDSDEYEDQLALETEYRATLLALPSGNGERNS